MHGQLLDEHRLKHSRDPTSAEWWELRREAEAKLAVKEGQKRKRTAPRLYPGMFLDRRF